VSPRLVRRLGPDKGKALAPKRGKTICGLQSVGLRRSPRQPLECGPALGTAFPRRRVNQGRSKGWQNLEIDRRTEPPARGSRKSRKQAPDEKGGPAGRDRTPMRFAPATFFGPSPGTCLASSGSPTGPVPVGIVPSQGLSEASSSTLSVPLPSSYSSAQGTSGEPSCRFSRVNLDQRQS
jgi:hypothetical protein